MYKEGNVWRFFAVTLLWSWGLLLVPVVNGLGLDMGVTRILFALAGVAPSLVAILIVLRGGNGTYRNDFFKRIVDFKRIGSKWYLLIFFLVPLTGLLSVLLNYLFVGQWQDFSTFNMFLSEPLYLFVFMIFTLFFGPLAEEIGWRGYATDQMNEYYHWLICCLVIGFFWALWHLPMYFIEGTYQWQLAQGSIIDIVLYNVEKFSTSIIMFWIYKNTRRSILADILYHFSQNFFGEILDLSPAVTQLQTGIQIMIAILIVVLNFKRFAPEKISKKLN